MVNPSETKNLVIIYQKLFNLALKRWKYRCPSQKFEIARINIRTCSSVNSFKKLLVENSKLREIMEEMFKSGEMLETLVKWRGQHCNMAISLKYLNRLENIIRFPEAQYISWTDDGKTPRKLENSKSPKECSNSDRDGSTNVEVANRTQIESLPPKKSQNTLINIYKTDAEGNEVAYDPCFYNNLIVHHIEEIVINKTGSDSIHSIVFPDPFERVKGMYRNVSVSKFLCQS